MKLEAEQPGLGAGYRILPQHLLRELDDTLGADRLDAKIKRAGLASGVDAGLDEPHIFLENGILGRDA